MSVGSIGRRYAKALLQIAVEQKAVDAMGQELGRVWEVMEQNGDILSFFLSPLYPVATKKEVLQDLAKRAQARPMIQNLLALLADRQRLDKLPNIVGAYGELADREMKRLRVQAISAHPLTPQMQGQIKDIITKATGKTVIMETSTDPELIGGVITRVGDLLLDGSVRSQLARLRSGLTGGMQYNQPQEERAPALNP